MPFLSSFLPGYGAVTVASLVVSGAAQFGGDVNASGGDLIMGVGRAVVLDASNSLVDCPLQFAGDPDLGIHRDSANDLRVVANGAAMHAFSASGSISLGGFTATNGATITAGNNLVMSGGYIEMIEIAAPAVPAADRVRIYGVVDGGLKTDLAARFQTGIAQVFAQEP